MLPKNASEMELSRLFSKYGTVKELQILRSSQQTSKGIDLNLYLKSFILVSKYLEFDYLCQSNTLHYCLHNTLAGYAFLKYETKEQALEALEAINGKHRMEVRSVTFTLLSVF